VNVLLLLPDRLPRVQVTVAVEVPALVEGPIVQVQLTVPDGPAVGLGLRPFAVEMVPEWYFTLMRHMAPGDVTATRVASELGATEAGRLLMVTASGAGLAVGLGVGFGVAVALGWGVGVAVGVGVGVSAAAAAELIGAVLSDATTVLVALAVAVGADWPTWSDPATPTYGVPDGDEVPALAPVLPPIAATTPIPATKASATPSLPRLDNDRQADGRTAEPARTSCEPAGQRGADEPYEAEASAAREVPPFDAGGFALIWLGRNPHLLHHAASAATIAPHRGQTCGLAISPPLLLPKLGRSFAARPRIARPASYAAAQCSDRTSACSRTVIVALACLSGG
jgi:hypothetical protein